MKHATRDGVFPPSLIAKNIEGSNIQFDGRFVFIVRCRLALDGRSQKFYQYCFWTQVPARLDNIERKEREKDTRTD
jgi:hypothetical protein